MRGDAIINRQRLMTQAVYGLADVIENSVGVQLKAITFAQLPADPQVGMLCCISDSNRGSTWGQTITAGGGPYIVLAFYDGTNWVVK
jgi:hypothetical protein